MTTLVTGAAGARATLGDMRTGEGRLEGVREIFAVIEAGYAGSVFPEVVRQVRGREPRTFEEFARARRGVRREQLMRGC